MNEIKKGDEVFIVHDKLKKFIARFDDEPREGIHDFMEVSIFNMLSEAIFAVENYLKKEHLTVNFSELVVIAIDAYQKGLDGIKRSYDEAKKEVVK